MFSALARNEYWKRVWVLQKVVMARNVCVVYDKISIDLDGLWSRAERCMSYLDRCEQKVESWDKDHPTMWRAYHIRRSGGKIPLWQIQSGFRGYKSSQDSEKVYGLLGMIAVNDDGTSPVENIHVDYEKPPAHIWLDVLFKSSPPWTHLREKLIHAL